ncbi:transcription initiation factor IIE, beta subunit [Gonapodya prolifera JEL478]|uniref:Transcription initiation factor IIE subunit beta n=1 Tax=Gonapodya prolifera (strain JEL478) TaxID=1344416 RepID=A0A139APF8_GONPJ|nr:transcription initiation factor IIE, beta subunit [Gonapodya prolifera JEL478]|eukprot:KXS18630.1 transcription initiation factor IIE, beta subunit [Gonapodya prolifera JEL478]
MPPDDLAKFKATQQRALATAEQTRAAKAAHAHAHAAAAASTPNQRTASSHSAQSSAPNPKKRPRQPASLIQPAALSDHVLDEESQALLAIIDFLKGKYEPVPYEHIYNNLSIDLDRRDPRLESLITSNNHIIRDEAAKTLSYRYKFNIKNKTDLLNVLRQHPHEAIDIKELKESYPKALEAVEALATDKKCIVIRKDKDDSIRAVAYNEDDLNLAIDANLITLWHETKIPSGADLAKELDKVGLKALQAFVPEGKSSMKDGDQKVKKKRAGRVHKITNTHLKDELGFK